jgi:energy-coupling factor transporter ATP-binding protein EcfA2
LTREEDQQGRYVSVPQFLKSYFTDEGYELIAQYDIVDGMTFAGPTMRQEFDRIVAAAKGGATLHAPTLGESSSRPGTSPRSGSPPSAPTPARSVPRAGSQAAVILEPDQALDAIRAVLGQPDVASAVVVDFTDKLIGDPRQQTEAELRLLVQLKKIVQTAAFLGQRHRLCGRKNTLVVVGGQLGAIPPWFYQDNPFINLLQVTKPRREERARYIRTNFNNFHESDALEPEERQKIEREFADLTDGLTTWDLDAIWRTSIAESFSIAQPKALVDYFKYGQREDPWERLDAAKIQDAQTKLAARVIGQDVAIEKLVDMLPAARVGLSMSEVTAQAGKPKGVFFFVGPTGVGKTELAKALTALIFSDDAAFDRYDMSEYKEQHSAEKLTGSPPGYVGYEEGGRLTNRMRERPFSVLLFDEIEKAHPLVMDKFLQILEDGRLTDSKGQTAYFSQSVIIFTSNIGSDRLSSLKAEQNGSQPHYDEVERHYKEAVKLHFTQSPPQGLGRPELLNRFGENIVVFDLLRPEHIEGICNKFLTTFEEAAQNKRRLEIAFDRSGLVAMIRSLMAKEDRLSSGGRGIKTLLERTVERPVNRWVFYKAPKDGAKLKITAGPDGHSILVNGQVVPR